MTQPIYIFIGVILLIVGLFLVTEISLKNELSGVGMSIPSNYNTACDGYFGIGNWSTIGMDWIDHDPKFIRAHGDLFYQLNDKNNNLHAYGCVYNTSIIGVKSHE